jgi:hypothetical protein
MMGRICIKNVLSGKLLANLFARTSTKKCNQNEHLFSSIILVSSFQSSFVRCLPMA